MKRIITAVFALLISVYACTGISAVSIPTVNYDGGTRLLYTDENGGEITGNGNFGTAFSNMLPGVEYSQNIVLKNTSAVDTVRFYMNMSVLKTLSTAKLDGAGYTVVLKTENAVLYSSINGEITGSVIGGEGSVGELADVNNALKSGDGNGFLVEKLSPGESGTLTLSIKADATMSDAYQDAEGMIQFTFFCEKDEPDGKVTTVYVPGQVIIETVKTGQSPLIYGVAAVLSAAVIVLLITGRKKSGRQ